MNWRSASPCCSRPSWVGLESGSNPEIASRGNTAAELERKRLAYLAGGAAEVWIVYPETRSMQVSRQDGTVTAVDPTADYRCERIAVVATPEYRTPVV